MAPNNSMDQRRSGRTRGQNPLSAAQRREASQGAARLVDGNRPYERVDSRAERVVARANAVFNVKDAAANGRVPTQAAGAIGVDVPAAECFGAAGRARLDIDVKACKGRRNDEIRVAPVHDGCVRGSGGDGCGGGSSEVACEAIGDLVGSRSRTTCCARASRNSSYDRTGKVNRRERSFRRQLEVTHGPIDATAHIQKQARLTISSQPRDA